MGLHRSQHTHVSAIMQVRIRLGVSVGLEVGFLIVTAVFYGWEWDTLDMGEIYAWGP